MPTIYERSWQSVLPASVDSRPRKSGYISISAGSASESATGGGSGLLSFPVIFSQYSVELREKFQALETFNEFVHVYSFGRAIGQANLSGHVLAEGNGNLNSLKSELINAYDNRLRARKLAEDGSVAIISGPGGAVIQGIVISLAFNIGVQGGGGDNVINFTLNMLTAGSRESPISATAPTS